MFFAQSLLKNIGPLYSASKDLSFARTIHFTIEFMTEADTSAPFKRRAVTVSTAFFISSFGNRVGLPVFS